MDSYNVLNGLQIANYIINYDLDKICLENKVKILNIKRYKSKTSNVVVSSIDSREDSNIKDDVDQLSRENERIKDQNDYKSREDFLILYIPFKNNINWAKLYVNESPNCVELINILKNYSTTGKNDKLLIQIFGLFTFILENNLVGHQSHFDDPGLKLNEDDLHTVRQHKSLEDNILSILTINNNVINRVFNSNDPVLFYYFLKLFILCLRNCEINVLKKFVNVNNLYKNIIKYYNMNNRVYRNFYKNKFLTGFEVEEKDVTESREKESIKYDLVYKVLCEYFDYKMNYLNGANEGNSQLLIKFNDINKMILTENGESLDLLKHEDKINGDKKNRKRKRNLNTYIDLNNLLTMESIESIDLILFCNINTLICVIFMIEFNGLDVLNLNFMNMVNRQVKNENNIMRKLYIINLVVNLLFLNFNNSDSLDSKKDVKISDLNTISSKTPLVITKSKQQKKNKNEFVVNIVNNHMYNIISSGGCDTEKISSSRGMEGLSEKNYENLGIERFNELYFLLFQYFVYVLNHSNFDIDYIVNMLLKYELKVICKLVTMLPQKYDCNMFNMSERILFKTLVEVKKVYQLYIDKIINKYNKPFYSSNTQTHGKSVGDSDDVKKDKKKEIDNNNLNKDNEVNLVLIMIHYHLEKYVFLPSNFNKYHLINYIKYNYSLNNLHIYNNIVKLCIKIIEKYFRDESFRKYKSGLKYELNGSDENKVATKNDDKKNIKNNVLLDINTIININPLNVIRNCESLSDNETLRLEEEYVGNWLCLLYHYVKYVNVFNKNMFNMFKMFKLKLIKNNFRKVNEFIGGLDDYFRVSENEKFEMERSKELMLKLKIDFNFINCVYYLYIHNNYYNLSVNNKYLHFILLRYIDLRNGLNGKVSDNFRVHMRILKGVGNGQNLYVLLVKYYNKLKYYLRTIMDNLIGGPYDSVLGNNLDRTHGIEVYLHFIDKVELTNLFLVLLNIIVKYNLSIVYNFKSVFNSNNQESEGENKNSKHKSFKCLNCLNEFKYGDIFMLLLLNVLVQLKVYKENGFNLNDVDGTYEKLLVCTNCGKCYENVIKIIKNELMKHKQNEMYIKNLINDDNDELIQKTTVPEKDTYLGKVLYFYIDSVLKYFGINLFGFKEGFDDIECDLDEKKDKERGKNGRINIRLKFYNNLVNLFNQHLSYNGVSNEGYKTTQNSLIKLLNDANGVMNLIRAKTFNQGALFEDNEIGDYLDYVYYYGLKLLKLSGIKLMDLNLFNEESGDKGEYVNSLEEHLDLLLFRVVVKNKEKLNEFIKTKLNEFVKFYSSDKDKNVSGDLKFCENEVKVVKNFNLLSLFLNFNTDLINLVLDDGLVYKLIEMLKKVDLNHFKCQYFTCKYNLLCNTLNLLYLHWKSILPFESNSASNYEYIGYNYKEGTIRNLRSFYENYFLSLCKEFLNQKYFYLGYNIEYKLHIIILKLLNLMLNFCLMVLTEEDLFEKYKDLKGFARRLDMTEYYKLMSKNYKCTKNEDDILIKDNIYKFIKLYQMVKGKGLSGSKATKKTVGMGGFEFGEVFENLNLVLKLPNKINFKLINFNGDFNFNEKEECVHVGSVNNKEINCHGFNNNWMIYSKGLIFELLQDHEDDIRLYLSVYGTREDKLGNYSVDGGKVGESLSLESSCENNRHYLEVLSVYSKLNNFFKDNVGFGCKSEFSFNEVVKESKELKIGEKRDKDMLIELLDQFFEKNEINIEDGEDKYLIYYLIIPDYYLCDVDYLILYIYKLLILKYYGFNLGDCGRDKSVEGDDLSDKLKYSEAKHKKKYKCNGMNEELMFKLIVLCQNDEFRKRLINLYLAVYSKNVLIKCRIKRIVTRTNVETYLLKSLANDKKNIYYILYLILNNFKGNCNVYLNTFGLELYFKGINEVMGSMNYKSHGTNNLSDTLNSQKKTLTNLILEVNNVKV